MQTIIDAIMAIIHEYGFGVGGFSLGVILLCMLVLVYQDDIKKSFVVYGLLAVIILLVLSIYALFFYSTYGQQAYMCQLCTLPVIPVVAYTIFRTVEIRKGKMKFAALAVSVFIFLMACSFSDLSFKEFKFYEETSEEQIVDEDVVEEGEL